MMPDSMIIRKHYPDDDSEAQVEMSTSSKYRLEILT